MSNSSPIWSAGAGPPPPPGSDLYPLDGVNDPWRWSPFPPVGGWVGPAYEVTWTAGAVIPSFGPYTGATEVDLYVSAHTTLDEAQADYPELLATWGTSIMSSTGAGASNVGTATASGSGIAFLTQFEAGYTGPTSPHDPGLDVTTMLGTGVTVGAPYTFPTGPPIGDYWLDLTSHKLYGPLTGTGWGTPFQLGLDDAADHTVTGVWKFLPATAAKAPLTLAGGTLPASGDLANGEVAIWYDATVGVHAVKFKGKDTAGTVFTASLPLT